MSKYYFEVNNAGEIIGADFISEGAEVPEGFVLPWGDDFVLNVPKYNFSTGIWEEAGEPVPEVEYPSEGSEHDDEPQETIEETIEKIKGEVADLKDRLEQQEALLFELMGGKGEG